MGKSSKKSATKVEAAPAVSPAKAGKKGNNKREAEEALQKIVSAKKQKKNDGVAQATQKAKVETKTLKKKKHESSDSDDSSSEEEEVKVLPKKAVKPTKPPAKESSDSESDSGSELESDEEPPVKAAPAKEPIAVKNGSHGAAAKKGKDDSSSSDSSEDESSDDEEIPAKASAPKNVPAQPATIKKAELSDDSESDSDDSESTDDDKGASAKASSPKKVPAPAAQKKADSSDDDSDSDESSSEDEAPAAKAAVASKKPSSVTETKESKQAKATAQKESSSEEESSSDGSESEEDGEDEKPAKTPKKNGTDVEMVDADIKSDVKTPKTPVTPVTQENTGSKTLFVGNLSFQVERADVENFFKGAGEVADVRFALDADERFRGFGHVEFTTAEAAQKALKLNGKPLLGRDVRLDLAREKGSNTPYSKDSNSFPKGGSGQSQTIFVKGFDNSAGEDEIRTSLQEHFGSCGDIKRISIPTDYDTGAIKGMAYLEFNDAGALNKAFELNGSQLGEYSLTVDEAKPRSDNRDSGRGRGRGSGGRGRGGRFDSGRGGRFDSGRGGRGGRGRGTPFKPSVTSAASGKRKTFNDEY
ncbi:nucleolin 2-like [Populus alba x Populus x berolinensis]|nr:nucleolin 2-like [Populus alba x Populus x berolinensis]